MNTVLWLASWYPSKVAPFNGDFIQRHAKAAALIQPVHVVYVVKDAQGAVCSRLLIQDTTDKNLRETIIYYNPVKTGWSPLDQFISLFTYYAAYFRYVKHHIKKNGKPALVHLQVVMRAGLIALWIKRKYSVDYVVTEHWSGYKMQTRNNYYQQNFFFRFITKKVLKHAGLLLPVSKELGDVIASNIQPVKYCVVPNAADTSLFYLSNYRAPVFRFIHVSSMQYEKNIPGILHTLKKLLILSGNWEFVMVGPAEDDIKKYSHELGLHQNLRWVGELSYKEVAGQMQQASACVLFSRYENLPCVLIEAACCGIPVIAPRIGGIPEIVNDGNGLLVDAENEDQLLQAMVKMMKNYDEYNKKTISDMATSLFSYENIGKKIADSYKNLLRL